MAEVLKGVPVAVKLTEELTARCERLKALGITPTLAMLRIGEKPNDIAYESGALKRCEKIGIAVLKIVLPSDAKPEEIISVISKINE
ncbi:MAG: bifunctional 5,10-methylene-tetrahydrofolate dehydrogenase/5,10-methylene-tetrahydrofolate cyclohydrolase, partial [Synergistaceae bacterium]|nr:bifunctional 5,10-methylene-tetrahydrofolate dehydrogenase/5,10-methylene-tetrahydrofolate cyclohydrolase [Synergistaceae bacterium]